MGVAGAERRLPLKRVRIMPFIPGFMRVLIAAIGVLVAGIMVLPPHSI